MLAQASLPCTEVDRRGAGILSGGLDNASSTGACWLFEEGHVRAAEWFTLVDTLTSPGMTDETVRIFLARDLTEVPALDRHVGVHEELEMETTWVPLDDAVERCLSGELENGITVAGLLAARVALTQGLAGLRASTAPWRARKGAAQAAVLHETRPAGGA